MRWGFMKDSRRWVVTFVLLLVADSWRGGGCTGDYFRN